MIFTCFLKLKIGALTKTMLPNDSFLSKEKCHRFLNIRRINMF